MTDISIVIPHFNNPQLIKPCLSALDRLDSDSPSFEVVVVDDASTDDSVASIRKDFPKARVVAKEENGGFVAAIQTGVDESEAPLLVFLNNDTRAEEGWLKTLAEPLLSGKVEGATGSVLTDWEGERALFCGASVNHLGFGFEDQGDLPDPAGAPVPQLMVCGGAMAIPRKIYEDSGGFDPSYVSLYEDLDLGWRLNLLGYDCALVPGSRVAHRAHASLGRQSWAAKAPRYIGNAIRTVFKNSDEKDHLKRVELAVTLAEARERVTLQGEKIGGGFLDRLRSTFQMKRGSTPIVEALVREEEATRELAEKRAFIKENRTRTTAELFERFCPNPKRGWYYDEEQNRLLEEGGYWDYERRMYERYGL